MIAAVTEAFTGVLGWVGSFVDALVTTDGSLNALLPLFAIGIAVSVVYMVVRVVKSVIWGA